MDFINLWPYDLVDLVFQHLTGKEILQTMEVSKSWNHHLMRSSALKKIVIEPNSSNIKYFLNSQKKYRHIKIVNGSAISREIVEIISNPLHEFNSIVLFRTTFFERKQLEQILLNSCRTLERLDIHYADYLEKNENDESLEASYDFPRLKSLILDYHTESIPWINKFFARFPKIESLTLSNACDEHFKNLILSSRHLKRIALSGKFYDSNFYRDMSEKFPSQLEDFEFNNILSSSREDRNLSYFNAFFTSQSKTLCRFQTDALLEIDELESAFRMPNLKELYIKGFHYNIELMEVYLEHMRTKNLPAAALTTFSVHFMNQHLLELLAYNARNLTELKVAQFDPCDVSNETWFQKLTTLKLFFIDSDLKKRLKAKPENQQTHFEKMIVKGMAMELWEHITNINAVALGGIIPF